MLQATVCDGGKFDASAFCEDRLGPAEVNVGRGEVVDALMVADVVVMLDEGIDLPFEIFGQIIVVEQDAVLESQVPPSCSGRGCSAIMARLMLQATWPTGSETRACGMCGEPHITRKHRARSSAGTRP